jgi:hypothetical protein
LRDAIISFFSDEKKEKNDPLNDYCKTCKQLKKDVDCSKCSKTFEVIEVAKKR